jgi:hypothetical protein
MWRGSLLVGVCSALLVCTTSICADERGWLLGSAGFFGKQFVGDAGRITILVACRGKTSTIQTDERGDYGVQLGACRYHLVNVVGADGTKLRIHTRQARTFTITKGSTTRFDLMIDP